jgi:uncharacterized protein YodC (DUF2158 family)
MNQWKIGDVVWHKSGGPKMVVNGTNAGKNENRILCEWWDEAKSYFNHADFGPEELTDKTPSSGALGV